MSDCERRGRSKDRRFRELCDLCKEPLKPGRRKVYGRAVTYVNADKLVELRDMAELALKLFNDKKSTSFKLVKVCKINKFSRCYWMTFRAREDGVKECLVFRGVVRAVGPTDVALFCEIKDDDVEVTLLPDDDDYVSPEQARESED